MKKNLDEIELELKKWEEKDPKNHLLIKGTFSKNWNMISYILDPFSGRIVLLSGRQWLAMIEGSQTKDFSILSPVMEEIDESKTVSKLKDIENINSQQEKFYIYLKSLFWSLIIGYKMKFMKSLKKIILSAENCW